MKTIEEKAKAYDSIIEKANKMHSENCEACRACIEELIPELAESEDEKVRKEIIELVMQPIWKTEKEFHRRNELCAWLEKQGQVKESTISQHENKTCKENDDSLTSEGEMIRKALLEMVHDTTGDELWIDYNVHKEEALAWLEKQGEKKLVEENKGNIGGISSNWSEEDTFKVQRICKYLNEAKKYYADITEVRECIEWLKSLEGRVGCEANCTTTKEWSEDDKRKIDRIYSILRQAADTHAFSTSCRLIGDKECMELQDFLKSLRPQSGYNPYKAVVESIAEMCKHYDKASHSGLRDFYDNVKVKCKDAQEYDKMFPQAQWKPSELQLGCLSDVIEHYNSLGCPAEKLKELLDDLKKLNGGEI